MQLLLLLLLRVCAHSVWCIYIIRDAISIISCLWSRVVVYNNQLVDVGGKGEEEFTYKSLIVTVIFIGNVHYKYGDDIYETIIEYTFIVEWHFPSARKEMSKSHKGDYRVA